LISTHLGNPDLMVVAREDLDALASRAQLAEDKYVELVSAVINDMAGRTNLVDRFIHRNYSSFRNLLDKMTRKKLAIVVYRSRT
jgi:hypothetical protein